MSLSALRPLVNSDCVDRATLKAAVEKSEAQVSFAMSLANRPLNRKEIHQLYWRLIEPDSKGLFIPLITQKPDGVTESSFLQLALNRGFTIAIESMQFMGGNGEGVKTFETLTLESQYALALGGDGLGPNLHTWYWSRVESAELIQAMVNKSNPLLSALENGYRVATWCMLAMGAKVNIRNESKQTPLHFAATLDLDLVKVLVSKGADVNAEDEKGRTPLFCAIQAHQVAIAAFLLKEGAKYPENAKDAGGNRALHLAVQDPSMKKIALELIKQVEEGKESLINACNDSDQAPLHLAVDDEVAFQLIQTLADVNLGDSSGRTPLHYAVEKNRATIAWVLHNYKANWDKADKSGTTPLYMVLIAACEKWQIDSEDAAEIFRDVELTAKHLQAISSLAQDHDFIQMVLTMVKAIGQSEEEFTGNEPAASG